MRAYNKKVSRWRRGQTVVEFALVAPLFLLFLFGAIEFGRCFFCLHLLANAAREGAREASLPNKTSADVEAAVDVFLQGVSLDLERRTTDIQVIPAGETEPDGTTLAGAISGDRVQVTVDYDFQVLTGDFVPGLSDSLALTGRCVFRHE